MSVTTTTANGVTVYTVTSDPNSRWPPLCQILKNLCYSPVCCSVSEPLRTMQRTSQSVLGTLHIMVGCLNIGLGLILCCLGDMWNMEYTVFPFWLGGLFVFFGIMCILSEKYPSPCLVILSVVVNLLGVGIAIAAITLYSLNLAFLHVWHPCEPDYFDYVEGSTPTVPPRQRFMLDSCMRSNDMILLLVASINIVLIVLSVLELCVVLSSAVMGIKSLKASAKGEDQSYDDPENFKPLLEDVAAQPVA